MTQDYETLIGSIYDCAADPAHWPLALGQIRDAVDAVYVGIEVAEGKQFTTACAVAPVCYHSAWDGEMPTQLVSMFDSVPHGQAVLDLPEDVSWSQLSRMQESEFRKTSFYRDWLKPQNLRDVMGVNAIKRKDKRGLLSMPTAANREPVTVENRALVERLSPHIRRAVTLNDLSNNSVFALSLYQQVVDKLSVAVFIVGPGQKIILSNSLGEGLLSEGRVVFQTAGALRAHRVSCEGAGSLEVAIGRALAGEHDDHQGGHGIALVNPEGVTAAAYVLPLAGQAANLRHCAVFVTQRAGPTAMAVDVLRTMFDLTTAEARIALLVASGESPQRISVAQGVAMNTVRTHLKHIYSKLNVSDQTGLAGQVSSLLPPIK